MFCSFNCIEKNKIITLLFLANYGKKKKLKEKISIRKINKMFNCHQTFKNTMACFISIFFQFFYYYCSFLYAVSSIHSIVGNSKKIKQQKNLVFQYRYDNTFNYERNNCLNKKITIIFDFFVFVIQFLYY